ncbi:uncharacterized protein V6R79_007138 [Siganus canaliculatus]
MRMKSLPHICLMLALLQITTPVSAQNTSITPAMDPALRGYTTRPADLKVAVGEAAVFRCGASSTSTNLTFTFYGSHGNYSLTCPDSHVEIIAQALFGSCEVKEGELVAVWNLKGTSFSDNGTRVVCQQSGNSDSSAAVLHVYDSGARYATLIGCTIGGFFGLLLVAALLFTLLQTSESFRRCFRGKGTEDDLATIVTED